MQEIKNLLIEDYLGEIHPYLRLTNEEYEYMEGEDKEKFLLTISDLLKTNLKTANFEYVKELANKFAVKQVEEELKRKNKRKITKTQLKDKKVSNIDLDDEETKLFKSTFFK